jgi:arsenate reductase-like glutaredoxin family protein
MSTHLPPLEGSKAELTAKGVHPKIVEIIHTPFSTEELNALAQAPLPSEASLRKVEEILAQVTPANNSPKVKL